MLSTASCSTMEASKRDSGNDGDGLSFGVDEDLAELSCSSMADRTKEMDGSFVRKPDDLSRISRSADA